LRRNQIAVFMLTGVSLSACCDDIPQMNVIISQANFEQWLGQGLQELPDRVEITLPQKVWDVGGSQFNFTWHTANGASLGQCAPVGDSTGLNVFLEGVNDKQIAQDNVDVTPKVPSPISTKAWIAISTNAGNITNMPKHQRYECDLQAKVWWPQFGPEVVFKVFVDITIPPPACSLAVQPELKMPSLTSDRDTVEATLPVTVSCRSVSGLHYTPKVNLTLNTSNPGIDGHLYEDNSVILKMLYGANDAQDGKEWMANSLSQYTMGVIKDGDSKTVTPVVQASRKKGGKAEKYDVKATIYMNFS